MKSFTLTTLILTLALLPFTTAIPNLRPTSSTLTSTSSALALSEPTSIPFLPTDFFLPGESSTREYLPSFTTVATEAGYAPPPSDGDDDEEDGGKEEDVITEVGGHETYTTAAGWADPKSEMGFPFRGGVGTRVWGE